MFKAIFAGIPTVQKVLVILGLIVSIAYCSKSKDLEIAVRDNTIIQTELTDVKGQLETTRLEREKIEELNTQLIIEGNELKEKFKSLDENTRTQFAELANSVDSKAIAPELAGSVEAIKKSVELDENITPAPIKPVKVVDKARLDRAFKISLDAMYKSYCIASGKCEEK